MILSLVGQFLGGSEMYREFTVHCPAPGAHARGRPYTEHGRHEPDAARTEGEVIGKKTHRTETAGAVHPSCELPSVPLDVSIWGGSISVSSASVGG